MYSRRCVNDCESSRICDQQCEIPQTINLGGGGFTDIDFVLRGPDIYQLVEYANQLRERAPELGLVDADVTLKLDKPELRVEIDRARAADLGVDTTDIATALRLMVGGDERVSRFRDASVNEDYDVQLRLKQGDRNDRETIMRLFVPSTKAGLCSSTMLSGSKQRLVRLELIDLTAATGFSRGLVSHRDLLSRIESRPCAMKLKG